MGDNCAVVLAGENKGKAILLAAATDKAVSLGFHAGDIIKNISKIVCGGGGGRPAMAQAGGKDASKIDEALSAARDMLN